MNVNVMNTSKGNSFVFYTKTQPCGDNQKGVIPIVFLRLQVKLQLGIHHFLLQFRLLFVLIPQWTHQIILLITACKPGYQIEEQEVFKRSHSNVASTFNCGELCDQTIDCRSYEYYENEKICTIEAAAAAGATGSDYRKQAKCVKSEVEGLTCHDKKLKKYLYVYAVKN